MSQNDQSENFVRQLTEHQNRIYGYVYSLLGDHSRAADVVQEVNLVLWRKISEFDPKRPFLPWAFAIARFQVLAHIRDNQRDRLLLDEELATKLCEETESQSEHFESIQVALRTCMNQLSAKDKHLVHQRYYRGMSVSDVAKSSEKSVGATKVALMRARQSLAECVQLKISAGEQV